MNEISLKANGRDLFEYHSDAIPRKGEWMRVEVDEDKGSFEVETVIHHVFKSSNKILNYVEIHLKDVTPK